jgi:hypothetical protein
MQNAAHPFELLWARMLRIGQNLWDTQALQQGSSATGITPTHIANVCGKLTRSIAPNLESGKQWEQCLTICQGMLTNPHSRVEGEGTVNNGGLYDVVQGCKRAISLQGFGTGREVKQWAKHLDECSRRVAEIVPQAAQNTGFLYGVEHTTTKIVVQSEEKRLLVSQLSSAMHQCWHCGVPHLLAGPQAL